MDAGNPWEDNDLGNKVIEVLSDITYHDPGHHLGRPFLTAYQLAISIKDRFPETFERLEYPIGGKGSGVRYSFTSYLAGQLSRRIRNGEFPNIEGGFLSNHMLAKIEFNDGGELVTSSSTDTLYDLSMFRYVESESSGTVRP